MSSVGKTAFILAILILPTTLLVLLGYVAYHFIGGDSSVPGHAGDNLALDIGEHDAISNEEGKFFNNAGNGTINVEEGMIEVAQETQQQTTTTTIATAATTTTTTTTTTSQLSPTNIISTDFTAYEQVPHDTTSFTQGLSYGGDGYLYETTGLR
eukprot:scaffold42757_cov189-Skeletonema_dohrnii-CCMP3373.AAC.1